PPQSVQLLVRAKLHPQFDLVAVGVGRQTPHNHLAGSDAQRPGNLARDHLAHLVQSSRRAEIVDEDHRRAPGATRPPARAEQAHAAELADRLHSAAIHLLRRLRRTDPQTGISAAQLSALSVLMGGPRTISELAAAEQVQPPTMSRLVREMEAAGLVERE